MPTPSDVEGLRVHGSGVPASDDVALLYHWAFREFGPQSLWSRQASDWPTLTQALTIADTLRREGNIAARGLAIRIGQACRVAL